jgi:hypothetical protein
MSKYCGPFVLSEVLKCTPAEAEQTIIRITEDPRYRRGVRGMFDVSMRKVLVSTVGIRGYVFEPNMQLKTWAKVRQKWNDKGTWVVLVTSHYVLYKDGIVRDTICRDGVDVINHPVAKRKVRRAWYLGELT